MTSFDDTFDPTALTRSDTITSIATLKNLPSAAPKPKSTNFTRIDLEPLYTDLKDAIGHRWDVYFDAITRFTKGELHSREFGDICDEILYGNDNVLRLHNKFVCAIALNATKDSPDPGIATWVTAASDKNTSAKTAVTSDAGERRLKKEVMAITGRDRRRLKNVVVEDEVINQYEESYQASRIRVPDVPTTGLTKTNWEPEIKKRYQQTLFVETSEFPDASNVYARMIPICYEEAIPQGSNMQCAELVVTSAEFYLKDFLGTVFDRVRANGPRYENGIGGGIFTSRFQKQVYKEQDLVKSGRLQKSREDELLPIESQVAKEAQPLGLADFKLASRTGPHLWNRAPLLDFEMESRPPECEYDDWKYEHESEDDTDDEMDWEGEGYGGRGTLDSLLTDCLAMTA